MQTICNSLVQCCLLLFKLCLDLLLNVITSAYELIGLNQIVMLTANLYAAIWTFALLHCSTTFTNCVIVPILTFMPSTSFASNNYNNS